jgi:D-alanyl-D-alanine carboxypeptidase
VALNLIARVRLQFVVWAAVLLGAVMSPAQAGQFAAYIMDARTGQTLYSENADTRLNPASLTKMMTLYITFQEIEAGRLSLDTMITVSQNAANQPPSRLGLKAGQKVALRYLIRAAAVKSANDAAVAIGDALAGSPEKWGARMTRTARQLGMKNSTFRNANGLTATGHLSTARDLTILGRHLFYDFPQYYNIFSRKTTDAGLATVANTNHAFLDSYKGADGIKTGYTDAAGFNLTASAERDGVRLIGTVMGARSTAERTARISALFDAAFKKAPKDAVVAPPAMASVADPENTAGEMAVASANDGEDGTVDTALPEVADGAGKTLRLAVAVTTSPLPQARPQAGAATAATVAAADPQASAAEQKVAAMQDSIAGALAEATAAPPPPGTLDAQAVALSGSVSAASVADPGPLTVKASTPAQPVELAAMVAPPPKRQAPIYDDSSATATTAAPTEATETDDAGTEVVRVSTSGGGNWGVTLGTYNTRSEAERLLLKIQLSENATLGESLRKVVPHGSGYEADFFGLGQDQADLACRRLQARGQQCFTIGP